MSAISLVGMIVGVILVILIVVAILNRPEPQDDPIDNLIRPPRYIWGTYDPTLRDKTTDRRAVAGDMRRQASRVDGGDAA